MDALFCFCFPFLKLCHKSFTVFIYLIDCYYILVMVNYCWATSHYCYYYAKGCHSEVRLQLFLFTSLTNWEINFICVLFAKETQTPALGANVLVGQLGILVAFSYNLKLVMQSASTELGPTARARWLSSSCCCCLRKRLLIMPHETQFLPPNRY